MCATPLVDPIDAGLMRESSQGSLEMLSVRRHKLSSSRCDTRLPTESTSSADEGLPTTITVARSTNVASKDTRLPLETNRSMSDLGTEGRDQFRRPSNKRRHSYAGPSAPPHEFFCPISRSLMTEPVKLMNTGVTLNRTSLQDWLRKGSMVCPVTATKISGWVAVQSDEALRLRIQSWAAEQGLNFELLDAAAALLQQWRAAGAEEHVLML